MPLSLFPSADSHHSAYSPLISSFPSAYSNIGVPLSFLLLLGDEHPALTEAVVASTEAVVASTEAWGGS